MIDTINVIKIDNKTNEIIDLFSFKTNESMRVIKAEDKFLEIIKTDIEEPLDKDIIIDVLEEGFFKTPNFNIYLKYSN